MTEALDFLVKIEEIILNPIDNTPENNKKYFVTFPYPYTNGLIHLGHAFTILKAEFTARYKSINGFNILFPFSFHATGMPIVSSSIKLQRELSGEVVSISTSKHSKLAAKDGNLTQCQILQSMGIEDFPPFTDPEHWVNYFSEQGRLDLIKLGCCIDWSRTFTTTPINPYYDKFVQWQFRKLISMGYIKYGKRYAIYDPVDLQACAAHDMTEGEGATPTNNYLFVIKSYLYDHIYFLVFSEELPNEKISDPISYKKYVPNFYDFEAGKKYSAIKSTDPALCGKLLPLLYNNGHKSTISSTTPNIFIGDSNIIKNLLFQVENFEKTLIPYHIYMENDEFHYSIKLSKSDSHISVMKYSQPSEKVISRSGNECCVALLDQWYIDYGDNLWTSNVLNILPNTIIRNGLNIATETIKTLSDWPCTRFIGLGTRLPCDNDSIIDSLSDSTVYMALYPIYHLLKTIDIDDINDELFDSVFYDKEIHSPTPEHLKIVNDMRKEFNYWYPFDLRVSGRDLIYNHLVMSLFHHQALNLDQPGEFRINGHLKLDNRKMSKSTGNFITLRQCIKKYGISSTRYALAMAGDSSEDANFSTDVVKKAVIELFKVSLNIEKLLSTVDTDLIVSDTPLIDVSDIQPPKGSRSNLHPLGGRSSTACLYDKVFENELILILKNVETYYENGLFSMIMSNGYSKLQSCFGEYMKYSSLTNNNISQSVIRYVEVFYLVMYPIIPHVSQYLWDLVIKICSGCRYILLNKSNISKGTYPSWSSELMASYYDKIDYGLIKNMKILRQVIHTVNKRWPKISKKQYKEIIITVNPMYKEWQNIVIEVLTKNPDLIMTDHLEILEKYDIVKEKFKKGIAASFIKCYQEERLYISSKYDEKDFLTSNHNILQKSLPIQVKIIEDASHAHAYPGNPHVSYV